MAVVVSPSGARCLELPGRRAWAIFDADGGSASSTVRIVEIAPDTPGAPQRGPHVHDGFEECIHVLSGTGATVTDNGEYPVGPGDTVLVPAGERHATRNTGTDVLRLLCFFPVGDIRPGTREFPSWDGTGDAADA